MNELITLKNIDFNYKDKKIYKSLTYTFLKGRYVIQGENGGGKSTLLNMIAGFLEPQEGFIIRKEKIKISYLFQDSMLFGNLTVRENIMLKCIALNITNTEEKINEMAQMFNLMHKLEKKVVTLSGGERQRVQLAIVSCSKSDVILLDEPIANLDKDNSKEIMDYIFDLKCDLVIVVSHQYIQENNEYTLLELKEGNLVEV